MKKRIIFRLPDKMYERVNEAVEAGRFRSVSELIRWALNEFLSKEGESSR